jgi:hypothetical protein
MHGRDENSYKILDGEPEGKKTHEHLVKNGRVILKLILILFV